MTVLECDRKYSNKQPTTKSMTSLAYAGFHMGDYKKSIDTYDELMRKHDYDKNIHLYKACCLYALNQYKDAKKEIAAVENEDVDQAMLNRISLHLAHKTGEEENIMTYHSKLTNTVEDQLCLAALHYLRNHYEEATEIYKNLLLDKRDFHALNVYVALCYYKLDYYDVSLEILAVYLGIHPDSITGVNLKACNHY